LDRLRFVTQDPTAKSWFQATLYGLN
jgi:hypothetical protein